MAQSDIHIRHLFDRYQAAVFARNIEAFIALYHRDVRVFDTWGARSYDGVHAWRDVVGQWFSSIAGETVAVSVADIRIAGNVDLAAASAFATYAAIAPGGGTLRAMQNRRTWTLVRDGGSWLILHEHTSMPVSSDDLRALTACVA